MLCFPRTLFLALVFCGANSLGHAQKEKKEAGQDLKFEKVISLIDEAVGSDIQYALELSTQAIKIAERAQDSTKLALALKKHGGILRVCGEYEKSQTALFKALNIYESTGDMSGTARVSNSIGNLFVAINNSEKGKAYILRSLEILEKLGEIQAFSQVSNNLGVVYEMEGDYENSLKYYAQGLKYIDSTGNSQTYADLSFNVASCLIELERLVEAENHLQICQRLFTKVGDLEGNARTTQSLGYLSEQMGDYADAMVKYQIALDFAKQNQNHDLQLVCLNRLLLSANQLGLADSVEVYLTALSTINDDEMERRSEETILDIEAKYQTKKKEQEIVIQKAKARNLALENESKQRLIVIIIIALVIVALGALLGISLYRSRATATKLQLQNAMDEQEKEVYLAQLEASNDTRKAIAKDLHDELGGELAAARLGVDKLEEEGLTESNVAALHQRLAEATTTMRRISHNLMGELDLEGLRTSLEQLKKTVCQMTPISFDLHFELEGLNITAEVSREVYRMVRELTTNSLKHSAAGEIELQLIEIEDELLVMYEDDGKGFDPKMTEGGLGMKSMKERAASINGTIELDGSPGHGMTATIKIPLT